MPNLKQFHITINVILFARKNHLIILTFPPHCSHRLQPLDITAFGPFKSRYRASMNNWMTSNPATRITIYNVPEFAKDTFYSAFNIHNIVSGFKNTGIYPLNNNIFTEDDFLPSAITDHPLTSEQLQSNIAVENSSINQENNEEIEFLDVSDDTQSMKNEVDLAVPSTSKCNEPIPGTSSVASVEDIRPYPKAGPRKTLQQRRKATTKIITSTPE